MEREEILRETLCEVLNEQLRDLVAPEDCEIECITWQERDKNDNNWHYRAIFGDSAGSAVREQVDQLVSEAKQKYNIIEKRR